MKKLELWVIGAIVVGLTAILIAIPASLLYIISHFIAKNW